MERSTEEILQWNIKKIQSKAVRVQQRLNEISQKARNCQFDDVPDANLIVSNMGITMEQLEYDVDRLFGLLLSEGIGASERLTEAPVMLGVHNRCFFSKDITLEEQLHQIRGNESIGLNAYNDIVKQIKTLEGIVLSGNIIKRLDKLEKEETSRSALPRLDIIENTLLTENLPHRVEVLEKGTCVEISSRLKKLEALVQQTVKGVFGDESSIGSGTGTMASRLSTMENQLNEWKAQIHDIEEKLIKKKSTEVQEAFPTPKKRTVFAKSFGSSVDSSSACLTSQILPFKSQLAERESPESQISRRFKKIDDLLERYLCESRDDEKYKSSQPLNSEWYNRSVTSSEASLSVQDVSVRCSVALQHYGGWENGTVIRCVGHIHYNEGDVFDEDRCWFMPPVDGKYEISLEIRRFEIGSTMVEVWTNLVNKVEDVRCSVALQHCGSWVDCIHYNEGNAFDEDRCCFMPPVDGKYEISLEIRRFEIGSASVEVWTNLVNNGAWINCLLFAVYLQDAKMFENVWSIMSLKDGQPLRLRVSGVMPSDFCVFKARLLK